MKDLIGKTLKDIEKKFSFEYYLETKDRFLIGKPMDSKKLIQSFLDFNDGKELKVIKLYDGTIKEIKELKLTQIKDNLSLLAEEKGIFYDDSDDELATAYGFLCDNYFAEIMPGIIFFSGKEEFVNDFAEVLTRNEIKFHDPEKIDDIGKDIKIGKLRKLGRNEPCHCGSGKKYKKCCLDKDIEETGKPMKMPELWGEGCFAESISPGEVEEKKRTISMKHDEEMIFNCKECDAKISAHNKDWHAGMCDSCFNKKFDKSNIS